VLWMSSWMWEVVIMKRIRRHDKLLQKPRGPQSPACIDSKHLVIYVVTILCYIVGDGDLLLLKQRVG